MPIDESPDHMTLLFGCVSELKGDNNVVEGSDLYKYILVGQ